jgi:hypothetical protein
MSEQVAEPVRLSPAELRTLFLFEALDDDQLSWLSENGYSQTWLAGQEIYTEGDPSTYFFVLLSGTLSMHRRVENTEVELARTNQRGVYSGATQSFVKGMDEMPYWSSVRAGLRLLGDRRGGVRGEVSRVVPDGGAPDRGHHPGSALQPDDHRAAGAAAFTWPAVGRANP